MMQREMQQEQKQEWEQEQGVEESGGAAAGRAEVLTLSEDPETAALEVMNGCLKGVPSIPLPLPHAQDAIAVSPMTMLMSEGKALIQHLPTPSGDALVDAVMQGQSPAASAVRSRLSTPQLESAGGGLETVGEQFANRDRPLERLLVEADELAQRLPDKHVVELLAAIEIGNTPVARAVRSRTRLVLREGQDIIGALGASESSGHDDEAFTNLVQDASLILAAIQGAANSGNGVDDRSSVLSTLLDMAGSKGQGSFVAKMLYLDLVTSCRSVADGGAVDGSMSPHSQQHFRELLIQGKQMIHGLEERHDLSVMDAMRGGVATSR
jgi:hypothetical protein